jgi:hypothetical protein
MDVSDLVSADIHLYPFLPDSQPMANNIHLHPPTARPQELKIDETALATAVDCLGMRGVQHNCGTHGLVDLSLP